MIPCSLDWCLSIHFYLFPLNIWQVKLQGEFLVSLICAYHVSWLSDYGYPPTWLLVSLAMSLTGWMDGLLDNCMVVRRDRWIDFLFGWLDGWQTDWQVGWEADDWIAVHPSGSRMCATAGWLTKHTCECMFIMFVVVCNVYPLLSDAFPSICMVVTTYQTLIQNPFLNFLPASVYEWRNPG